MKMLTPEKAGNSSKELKGQRGEKETDRYSTKTGRDQRRLARRDDHFCSPIWQKSPGTTHLKPNQTPNCALDLLPGHDLNQNPFASKKG